MKALIAVAVLVGCRKTPSMPWLFGLADPVGSDDLSDEAARRIGTGSELSDVDAECSTGAYPGIALTADVAPSEGDETIIVSLVHGIVVLDRGDRMIAEAPGYRCGGNSVDELEGVAAGSAYGVPTIAIAATTGGKQTNSTWVSLFRIGADKKLDAVFTGVVETRLGTTRERGGIVLLPNALLYRHPGDAPTLWIYNPDARAYLRPAVDHEPPPLVSRR